MHTIYFDNAATSWLKPPAVTQAIISFLENSGGNPGRSGHRLALESSEIILECRELLAEMFSLKNPMHTIFTLNATMALNMAIQGVLSSGDHVIISNFEHNSVIRPLYNLQQNGIIDYSIWRLNPNCAPDLSNLLNLITPRTKMIIINHSSNVNGQIIPLAEIGSLCRKKGITFLVDAAQSAGTVEIDMQQNMIDLLAIAGHKGLYGPPGTGALLIGDQIDYTKIKPLILGGTGSLSTEITQPDFLPDRLESGTPNSCGIAGLAAGLKHLRETGISNILSHKKMLASYFLEQSALFIGSKIVHYSNSKLPNSGISAFNIKGCDPAEISTQLSDEYNIMCRAGLHCAPLAHQALQTYPTGCLRFSYSLANTTKEIDIAIRALKTIIDQSTNL